MDLDIRIMNNAENIFDKVESFGMVQDHTADSWRRAKMQEWLDKHHNGMTINHYFSQSSVSIVKNQNFIVGRRFYPTTDILVSAQNITDSNFKNKNNVIHVTNFQNSTWQRQSFYAEGRVINNSEVDVEIYWIDPADNNG